MQSWKAMRPKPFAARPAQHERQRPCARLQCLLVLCEKFQCLIKTTIRKNRAILTEVQTGPELPGRHTGELKCLYGVRTLFYQRQLKWWPHQKGNKQLQPLLFHSRSSSAQGVGGAVGTLSSQTKSIQNAVLYSPALTSFRNPVTAGRFTWQWWAPTDRYLLPGEPPV